MRTRSTSVAPLRRRPAVATTAAVIAAALLAAVLAGPLATPARAQDGPTVLEPGVSILLYELDRSIQQLRELIPGQTPNRAWRADTIDLRDGRGDYGPVTDDLLVEVRGIIRVARRGTYRFKLWSDDGSRLWIDDSIAIDNDGLHGEQPAEGEVELSRGDHPFRILHFEATGDAALRLEWMPPGADAFVVVPRDVLWTPKGEVRVTAPGPKRVMMPLMRGRPGDERPLDGVHPSYRLVDLRPDGFAPRVGGLDWLSDGRMVLCTWDRDGAVYLLDGTDGDGPEDVTVTRIAAGLAEPLGLTVLDDRIFVLQKQELTELIDHDGDDIIDEYRAACSGWDVTSNFHEFAFGLVEEGGFFYANLAIAIDPGGRSTDPQVPDRGTVIKIDPDAGTYEIVARGLRTPNGIGRGAFGDIYITDNQGDWLPVSKVVAFRPDAFFGSQAVDGAAAADWPVDPPVVWLPQNEIGNSPSEVAPLPHGPYAGQQVHGDVTHGGLKRVFVEVVDGVKQGAVFRFTQGLEAGSNRVKLGPDGNAFYVGGVGSTGNWGQSGKAWHGLQRLDWTGDPAFEMVSVSARRNGFEVRFTEPIASDVGNDPSRYELRRWRYVPTANYGGAKIDDVPLPIRSVSMSDDRNVVFLEVERADLMPDHVYGLHLLGPWRSDAGRRIWTSEAWYTMNRVPRRAIGTVDPVQVDSYVNRLTPEEEAAGFRLLFDGESTDGWRTWREPSVQDDGWVVIDGCLERVGSGDLTSEDVFDDFELRLEWAIDPGGNSGIMWRASEQGRYPWLTGPEYQILDNERHADGQNPATSAGSCYALYAPEYDVTFPPGLFNQTRIVVRGSDVEYWLNGELQCRFDLDSDDWRDRVAASKFADMQDFGRIGAGHIVLQDHGDRVRYRSIRIREF